VVLASNASKMLASNTRALLARHSRVRSTRPRAPALTPRLARVLILLPAEHPLRSCRANRPEFVVNSKPLHCLRRKMYLVRTPSPQRGETDITRLERPSLCTHAFPQLYSKACHEGSRCGQRLRERLSGARAACPAALVWPWDALEGVLSDSNWLSLTTVYRQMPFLSLILPVAGGHREPPGLARKDWRR